MNLPARVRAFLEERTGLFESLGSVARTPVRGGASLRHGTLAILVALLGAAVTTGLALALFYAPTVTSAWASLAWFEREIPFGEAIRAMHVHSAGALVLASALHLAGLAASGTYRRPREVSWWASIGLLVIVFGIAMTGTVLPMDEQGYWASRVEMGIVASTPVLGAFAKAVLVGGNDAGNLTLTRHFTLHAFLLTPLAAALVWVQVRLAVRHGLDRRRDVSTPVVAYWPQQAARDVSLALVAVAALAAVAVFIGAPLGGPADPSAGYSARPVWFFRPLFELRHQFPTALEPIATMVIPGLAVGYLASLPFIDRATALRARVLVLAPAVLLALGAAGGTWLSYARDAGDAAFGKQLAASATLREKSLALASQGVPAEGPLFMLRNTPEARGQRLYADKCGGCHAVAGEGGGKAPDFAGYLSESWLMGVLAHPEAPEYFGKTKVSGMESYEALGPEKLRSLARFLIALRAHPGLPVAKFEGDMEAGRKLFEGEGCDSCHSIAPDEVLNAPNLSGYGSDEWLTRLLEDPGHALFFGEDNDMPAYKGKLDEKQFKDLIVYLRVLENTSPHAPTAAAGP